jgi:hypothetical protein
MTKRQLAAIERHIIGLAVFAVVLPSLAVAQQLPRVKLTPDQINLIQHDVRATLKNDAAVATFDNMVAGRKNLEITYVCGLLNRQPFIGLLGKKADGSLGFLPLAQGDVAGQQCAMRGLTP